MSLRLHNLTRFWDVHTNVRRQVGSDRRAATLQEVEDHHHICAAAIDVSQMDRDDGEHRQNPTAADVVLWLGSDPAGSDCAGTPTDPETPTIFERLSASQREFAAVFKEKWFWGVRLTFTTSAGGQGSGNSTWLGTWYMLSAPSVSLAP